MDIVTILSSVGLALVGSLTKKIVDEKNIEKLVDWIVSVGNHIWSKKETTSKKMELPKYKNKDNTYSVSELDLTDFQVKRKVDKITSLMNQLDQYSQNLNSELEKAAKVGGVSSPDISLRLQNSIKDQQKEITRCFSELTVMINGLYGKNIEEIEELSKILKNEAS